jgi:hypothetical protein
MSHVTANDLGVVEAIVSLPRVGAWVATLDVDAESPERLTGAVTIAFGREASFVGTRFAGGGAYGRAELTIVGGGGGLATELPPQAYLSVPLRVPLGDVVRGAGEALADDVDPAVLNRILPAWVRGRGKASHALDALASAAGVGWRVRADGKVWLGVETWPASSSTAETLRDHPRLRMLELAEEVPRLLPGTTFGGKRVSVVRHVATAEHLRTFAHYE